MIRGQVIKLLLTAAALGTFSGGLQAQSYSVQDLGTLKPGSAVVHGVNASGQVVGQSGHPHGADTHAFFWQKQGGIRDLGTLGGGDYSAAFAINDSGVVVGTSNTADTTHAFSWTMSGGLHDLGTLAGTDASSATAINNQGQIVGSTGVHAALFTQGNIQDLGTLGGQTSEAHGINNLGAVVGVSDTADGPRAFLFQNGSMQNLGVLSGDTSSRADHINDSGMVVGASEGSGGVRAFIWTSAGGMQSLGSLSGSIYSEAFAVNNQGQVVGQSTSPLGNRAFLWTSQGGMVDLNELVPNLPGDTILTGAFSINDKGQIVAFGLKNPNVTHHDEVNADSHVHAGPSRVFLLTPQ
ncbi:MAG TPA: HAF repeat-containing protein [Candidatus Angelobacter sp.]|nr:HAF repeat-containing protein [Candidatus Angelobacter sp.]